MGLIRGRINMPVFSQNTSKHYRFKQLFSRLGWDAPAQQQPGVLVGDSHLAAGRGCPQKERAGAALPPSGASCPTQTGKDRRKITTDVREHLIVFTNGPDPQVWPMGDAPG